MNIEIRSEQIRDYHAIAEIHARAFTYNLAMGEVPLVDVHRHRAGFDPELSLVAVCEGKILGHVLLTPRDVLMSGESVKAGILAPIAVDPAAQKEGIGAQLMQEVHERAREKGIQFVVLLGHPTYYPRFGYQTHMFGTCQIKVNEVMIPKEYGTFEARRVKSEDVPVLCKHWHEWFQDTDLAIRPGESLLDWMSPTQYVCSAMVYEDGEWIGYVRYAKDQPERVRLFLTPSRQQVPRLLAYIRSLASEKAKGWDGDVVLPLHAFSPAIEMFRPILFQTEIQTWEAGMLKVLNENNALVTSYCQEVSLKRRLPGLVIWPVEFDLC